MFKSPVARSFLSLSACLFFILVPSADAAKVTLEKQEIYSEEGELLGFHDFTAQQLDSLGVELIADYATSQARFPTKMSARSNARRPNMASSSRFIPSGTPFL